MSSCSSEVEPQHIAPNDAVVFHQQIETCAPELLDEDAELGVSLRWIDVETRDSRSLDRTYAWNELLGSPSTTMLEGQALMAYVDALIARKKAIHGTGTADEAAQRVALARQRVQAALQALPADADLMEMDLILSRL